MVAASVVSPSERAGALCVVGLPAESAEGGVRLTSDSKRTRGALRPMPHVAAERGVAEFGRAEHGSAGDGHPAIEGRVGRRSRDLGLATVPVDQVAARELVVGDVVRLADPQAHRVERAMIAEGQVVLELRPVGLAVPDAVRVSLPVDAVVDRLGTAGD
jgi:hypothetical protein